MKKTLLVFPSDPLEAYLNKGEIKSRYFNPNNLFEKVIIVDFSQKKLSKQAKKKISKTVGDASLRVMHIHTSSRLALIPRIGSSCKRIVNALAEQKIDCVRAYGVLSEGVIATKVAKILGVPFVLSLHDNYDDIRRRYRRNRQWKLATFYHLWRPMEKKVIRGAARIIAVYGWAKKYAIDAGANEEKIEIIYNKIHEEIFYPPTSKDSDKLRIIFVSRMVWEKGQENLIKAMQGIQEQATLTLIGEGDKRENYELLVKQLKLQDCITIIPKVDNHKLGDYYRKADVLASPIRYGGVGIPVLEAMATGLAIVHAKYGPEENPDVITDVAMRVENTPGAFRNAFKELISSSKKREVLASNSRKYFQRINGKKMEAKEQRLYESLLEDQ